MTVRRARPEDEIQRTLIAHLAVRAVDHLYAFAVANGGYRRPVEAAVLKGLGVVAGVPDLVIIHEGRCFALELKADGGRLSEVQKASHVALRKAGATVGVAYGLDAALAQLESWGLLRGAVQ
jgi:hypothetical protein